MRLVRSIAFRYRDLGVPERRPRAGGRDRTLDCDRRVRPESRDELLHLRLLARPRSRHPRRDGTRQPRQDSAAGARAAPAGEGRARASDGGRTRADPAANWLPRPDCRARQSPKPWRLRSGSLDSALQDGSQLGDTSWRADPHATRSHGARDRTETRAAQGAAPAAPTQATIVRRHFGIEASPRHSPRSRGLAAEPRTHARPQRRGAPRTRHRARRGRRLTPAP